MIVTHLTETIRRHADELLTRQETRKLLDALKEANAAAVEEVVPDRLGVGEVQRVLQTLLREGVSIRDLGTILEAIGDRADRHPRAGRCWPSTRGQALARARSTRRYIDEDGTLQAITLDPPLEQEVAESLMHTPEGELLALDPARAAVARGRAAPSASQDATGARPPPGARLLEPRAPPPAAPDRAGAPAAAGARLHRDRPGHPRRGRRPRGGRMSSRAVDGLLQFCDSCPTPGDVPNGRSGCRAFAVPADGQGQLLQVSDTGTWPTGTWPRRTSRGGNA